MTVLMLDFVKKIPQAFHLSGRRVKETYLLLNLLKYLIAYNIDDSNKPLLQKVSFWVYLLQ